MNRLFSLVLTCIALSTSLFAQRITSRLDDGWRFSLGNASSPVKDFGNGTEYFNYLTKANSIHNEGPYSSKFDDSSWQPVRIPHDWVTQLPFAPEASHSHGYKTVGYKYPESSIGWYRKVFNIPASDFGSHFVLQFDGIFRNATVWFNGFYMGQEHSGYATQIYDITDYINFGGDNIICVRADASLEEGWFYEGAGIYRDVWLHKTNNVHVAPFGTFVYSSFPSANYDSFILHVSTEVENSSLESVSDCHIRHTILDADGNVFMNLPLQDVALDANPLLAKQTREKGSEVLVSKAPHLWDINDPYLYSLKTEVIVDNKVVDEYTTPFGVRDVKFTAENGFFLNGRNIKLKGVNMHQDHAGVGAAIPDALQAFRIRRLKSLGCNAYRASHNPMTPALLDICDREGILVIDENRLMGVNKEHLDLLERMIRRDRNHPSIILWSDGNEEWGLENDVRGTRIAASMREYTHRLDPSRMVTAANAGGTELIKGLEVVGYNYIVQNDVLNRHKAHPEWIIVGTEETTACGTRGVYFNDPSGKSMPSINRTDTTFENIIERGWRFYDETPWAAGLFYWTGFDYRGEGNPLSYPAVGSEFGILDYCGFDKDEAWYLRSWWTDQNVLHIFPHWNLSGHEGEQVSVWAYSNCDEVELFVNGKSAGRQKMSRNGHLKWNVVYKPGKLRAVGYKNGKKVMERLVTTTDKASKVLASSDRASILADSRDVSVLTVSLHDKNGNLVPDANNMVKVSVSGPAHILGVGNGDPAFKGDEHPSSLDCQTFQIPAFNGLAQVLIQSLDKPGQVVVSLSSDGLKETSVNLDVISSTSAK